MKAKVNRVTIQLVQADLLTQPVAAVVNATDTSLTLSSRIILSAGTEVQRECAALGYCEVGSAVATTAGNLPFARLIHAVGPRWGEGSERGKLTSTTFECLRLAEQHGLKSIALPAISTGAMGYPLENCATTMLTQIIDYTFEDLKHLRTIIICLDDALAFQAFKLEFEHQLRELRGAEV